MKTLYRTLQVTCLMAVHVICATFAKHGKDISVCSSDPVTPPGKPTNIQKPNISEQFSTGLELVISNQHTSQYITLYFDQPNNRAYMEQRSIDIVGHFWYDYDGNELISYFPDVEDTCSVQDLGTSTSRLLLGYQLINGKARISKATAALRFAGNGIIEVYMGRTTIRDINVDKWSSCQYWAEMDATMTVDWYFSAKDHWDSAVGISVPVMVHVKGVVHSNVTAGSEHSFEHYYNFYEFTPYLKQKDFQRFQLPDGVICTNHKSTESSPVLSWTSYSYTNEALDLNSDVISITQVHFDQQHNIVVQKYRALEGDTNFPGRPEIKEVRDFNTGVRYIVDSEGGNCTVKRINPSFDSVYYNSIVRMRTPEESFFLDNVKNLTYNGIKTVRDIECNTWVGRRDDFPKGAAANSTWQWFFATSAYNKSGSAGPIPVQVRFKEPLMMSDYIYNIFDFQTTPLDVFTVDISSCITQSRRFGISFKVDTPVLHDIISGPNLFKKRVLKQIVARTGVTVLRVAKLKVELAEQIVATFDLLDGAPLQGDVKKPLKEVSLDEASNLLISDLQNLKFVVELSTPDFTVWEILFGNLIYPIPTTTTISTTSTSTNAPSTSSTAATVSTTLSSVSPLVTSSASSAVTSGTISTSKPSTTNSGNQQKNGGVSPSSGSGLSGGATAGIVIGILVVLLVAGIGGFFLGRKYRSEPRDTDGVTNIVYNYDNRRQSLT